MEDQFAPHWLQLPVCGSNLLLYLRVNGSSQLGHSPDIVRITEPIRTLTNNTYRLIHPLRLRSRVHTKFLLLIGSTELL